MFFKKDQELEKLKNRLRKIEAFYSESIKTRKQINSPEIEQLQELFKDYKKAIKGFIDSFRKNKDKSMENYKAAINFASEIDRLLNFEEKNQQADELKVLSRQSEQIEIIKQNYPNINKNDFYLIPKELILQSTSKEYRNFLKEAGYGDLDSCEGILIEKKISKVNIKWRDGKKFVEDQGYKLLTTCLMYKLFIPHIKLLAEQGDKDAKKTLKEMVNTKAEWMEDLILNKSKIKIGNSERSIVLPAENNRFDRSDLNEFGYPNAVRSKGEFYYWHPSAKENVVIRNRDPGLFLDCDRGSSVLSEGLGVRRAKILPKKIKGALTLAEPDQEGKLSFPEGGGLSLTN